MEYSNKRKGSKWNSICEILQIMLPLVQYFYDRPFEFYTDVDAMICCCFGSVTIYRKWENICLWTLVEWNLLHLFFVTVSRGAGACELMSNKCLFSSLISIFNVIVLLHSNRGTVQLHAAKYIIRSKLYICVFDEQFSTWHFRCGSSSLVEACGHYIGEIYVLNVLIDTLLT